MWKCKNEQLRQLGVSFNNAVRKVFGCRRYESVKGILQGFCMLPLDFMLIVCVYYSYSDCFKSESCVVRMCAEVSADDEDVVRLCNEFNFALKWFSKAEIKEAVLQIFIDIVGW